MREEYVVRRKADYVTLSDALEKKSIQEFKHIGHQLAGNAESYGFPDLGKTGVKMEALNESDLMTEGIRLLSEFKNWLDTVVVTDDE
ncbi:MAG: Hpt domain-containing protein [Bdellovibrionaceae bacterium]|nr:Hpt domain-containing protein [Pseudobdellovibrionaceae bacterium]